MRPNMNIDITNEEVRKGAVEAFDSKGGFSNKQIVTIKEAYVTYTDNGSAWLNMSVESEGGKTYNFPKKCLCAGKDQDFKEMHDKSVLTNLLILAGASGNIDQITIPIVEFIDGQRVEVPTEVDSYADLVGKKVGCVINFYKKYPESKGINGYTGRPIPDKNADPDGYARVKKLATTIWMPNYEKEPQLVFNPEMWFDPNTGKTLKEMQDDECVNPVIVDELVEKLKKKGSDATVLDAKKWDELRIKKLKANFKKSGDTFDPKAFVNTVEGDTEDSETVSWDGSI